MTYTYPFFSFPDSQLHWTYKEPPLSLPVTGWVVCQDDDGNEDQIFLQGQKIDASITIISHDLIISTRDFFIPWAEWVRGWCHPELARFLPQNNSTHTKPFNLPFGGRVVGDYVQDGNLIRPGSTVEDVFVPAPVTLHTFSRPIMTWADVELVASTELNGLQIKGIPEYKKTGVPMGWIHKTHRLIEMGLSAANTLSRHKQINSETHKMYAALFVLQHLESSSRERVNVQIEQQTAILQSINDYYPETSAYPDW